MTAYYNEIDPGAAAWLRELIKVGVIADGYVDERDIRDVRPSELGGYTQCHFFAGIGVWSYALRLAGWPDDRPVWTGSCPCQPFSQAGKGAGFADERHLWPAWFHLIEHRNPGVIFGEQVAGPDGLNWFDLVSSDLEGTNHVVRSADTCAAGVGSPNIRQRLYWMAHALRQSSERGTGSLPRAQASQHRSRELHGRESHGPSDGSQAGALDFSASSRCERIGHQSAHAQLVPAGATNGFWCAADWIFCRDDKWRPVEPGTFPLAHGAAARVLRLRGYGNAINAYQAATFIETCMSI